MGQADQTSADQAGTKTASYDVFLSYAREDLSTVKALVSDIEAEGLTVFWDRHIQLGQQWSDVLDRALRKARVVIVVWSTASVKSTWVKAEATEALALGRLAVAQTSRSATLPECPPPTRPRMRPSHVRRTGDMPSCPWREDWAGAITGFATSP